jgi:hypothetical protein
MIIKFKECEIIKNSLNQSFSFYIDDKQNLVFDEFNEDNICINSSIIVQNILDFSVTIDKNNKIHLIYLLKYGELVYCIYLDNRWNKNPVARLDTKSNIYKHLNLYLHEKNINIFYSFTNLINMNVWSIEQITQNANTWERTTIANIFSEKTFTPFYIDSDRFGNIHLVYKAKDYDSYHIYYTFYNIFTKTWLPVPEKISSSTLNNTLPYLFIDSKSNVHILWYSLKNNDNTLMHKRLSFIGQEKYKWKEITLPKFIISNYLSVMIEDNNVLKIIYIENNEICYLFSTNHGESWNVGDKHQLDSYPIYLIKYLYNNFSSGFKSKINYCYGNIDNNIYLYFNDSYIKNKKTQLEALNDRDSCEDKDPGKADQTNTENIELIELKESLLEIKNQLTNISATMEKDIELLKEKVSNISTNMEKDFELLKQRVTNIEEERNKRKFLGFK